VADVVVAGEVLEHVREPLELVSEACRVLRPGGVLVLDTIAATRWGRFLSDHRRGARPRRSAAPAARPGPVRRPAGARRGRPALRVELQLTGLRVSALDYLAWARGQEGRGAHAADPVHRRDLPGAGRKT
jgi:2-polyprenyl-6-hydroxyphenyl methylase/3-demethylubiquinone-9 3-methyltransferase